MAIDPGTERSRLLRRMILEALRACQSGGAGLGLSVSALARTLNRFGGDYSRGEVASACQYLVDSGCAERLPLPPAYRDDPHYRILPGGVNLLDGLVEEDPGIA